MSTENTFKFERTAEEIWQSIAEVAALAPDWMYIEPMTLSEARAEKAAKAAHAAKEKALNLATDNSDA